MTVEALKQIQKTLIALKNGQCSDANFGMALSLLASEIRVKTMDPRKEKTDVETKET